MKGIVLAAYDRELINRAHGLGLAVSVAEQPRVAYERTLLVGQGADVPWDLLDAGWHFLERWEAASPLWRYGVLAKDVGTAEERARTERLTLDLRVPLYASELLFLRRCEGAERLLAEWTRESEGEAERRLAFLRALCAVKPLFLALPRSWLGEGR